ncbi:TetR/AcrR family transcriptional regulator [Actinocatenispora rupis]|uniref:HTH tetR-type domain-containing protein n=1 Tax=Actinocatenispora rupis TaxID=519421 RepID=A0A8J3NH52_9ACTN|nr:helix-turn-helix domain-containing protein [Actinocatenispora rupis]GID15599.1 hypothetical protein Aru02nite_64880 [Actinocatenispora rupis]
MPTTPSRGARYGALNRTVIVAAARTIADRDGLGQLTLRRVAESLGTGQASIYRHVSGRDELIAALCEDLAAGFPLVTDQRSPRTAALRQWEAIHRYLTEHPWGAPAIAAGDTVAVSGERLAAHATAQLRRLGLTGRDAARAYRVLWQLLLGHLLNAHPLGHGADHPRAGDESDFRWALRHLLDAFAGTPRRH